MVIDGNIQAELVREVDRLGSSWAPSYNDLEEKLPYMDAVINESLRLLPPAFITLREIEAGLDIDGRSCAAPYLPHLARFAPQFTA